MQKYPVEILKKKVTDDNIFYKIRWSNNATSTEPFNTLSREIRVLVQQFEIQKLRLSDQETKIVKQVKISTEEVVPQKQQQQIPQMKHEKKELIEQLNSITISEQKGHKIRKNIPCQIKAIRNTNSKIELQLLYEDQKPSLVWVTPEEMRKTSPITLCDFLLSKIRTSFTGTRKP